MKTAASAVLLAAVVNADYGAPAPTAKVDAKVGYTTVYPGHGHAPVTVTSQYQAIPTYVNDQWSEYEFIHTVFNDVYGNTITVSKTDEPLTVYQTKETYTRTAPVYGYAAPTGYYGAPRNQTGIKVWEELHQVIHLVPWTRLGPHAIPGYSGNPRYHGGNEEQEVEVREYTDGKWVTYKHTFTYTAPKPAVTTYDATGVYTLPANDITVTYPTTVPAEATYHATANKPCTYGGVYTKVTKPTTLTVPYGAYETHGTTTKTVIVTKTVTCNKPGMYTIVKPTVTVYPYDTAIAYPTITKYPAGVYHYPQQTVTITKPHQAYTCSYSKTSGYPVPAPTGYSSPSHTRPHGPDPSSDYAEPAESYGKASSGFVKRGGVLQRRKADPASPKAAAAKRVILV